MTLGVYYYYILYYILYLIQYTIILSYTILFSSSVLFLFPIFLSSHLPNHLIYLLFPYPSQPFRSSSLPSHSSHLLLFLTIILHSHLLIPTFILYVSVLGYTYLYSFQDNHPIIVLTPHKLTEWMVEVCRFEVCGSGCVSRISGSV